MKREGFGDYATPPNQLEGASAVHHVYLLFSLKAPSGPASFYFRCSPTVRAGFVKLSGTRIFQHSENSVIDPVIICRATNTITTNWTGLGLYVR